MEKSLIILKPEVLQRGLAGDIITRFERRGMTIERLVLRHLSESIAQTHYQEHRDKPFFASLVAYITSGPVVVMVCTGEGVIGIIRQMVGPTNPAVAPPGTIRGDYATTIAENIIHASDGSESAAREIALFFE
ncbi:nucleoside-diphosphate kinase [bacterium]|nr:nucleoside-diphosphate kinase [bacterium]